MELNTKNICIIGIFVSVILFTLMLVYVWNFTVDDAFISFTYSEHLANGFGLVWNIGQAPVEGYTDFLWVLIIAFTFLLKLDPVISTKVIGLLSVLGITVLFWFISNDIFKNKKNKYTAFSISTIFFLINPLTAIHTVSGLETMFYAFLLLGVVYSAWKIISFNNSKFIWLFAFSALLLSLTRPEGILISLGLIFLIIYVFYRKNKSLKLTPLIPILILYLVPIVIYMIFRISYFHMLLPISVLVKTIRGNIFLTISDLITALEYIVPFIIIILISLFIKYPRIKSQEIEQKTQFKYFLITLIVAFILANIVYIYTELMSDYGLRYFYPSFVLLYAASGVALSMLFTEIGSRFNGKLKKNTTRFIICLFIVFLLLIPNATFLTDLNSLHNDGNSLYQAHIALGKALSPYSKDNYTVASVDSGAITYYSKWNQIDILGLNNKFIGVNGIATPAYIEKTNPELIIINSGYPTLYNPSFNVEIPFYNFALENNYTELNPIKFNDHYYLFPFLKTNIKDYDSIKNSLEKVSEESNS